MAADALPGTIYEHQLNGRTVRFFVHEVDDAIQQRHAGGSWFDLPELETIGRHYRGGTFVDVGANVGNHSLYAALVLEAPRVVAIEPAPLTSRILTYNVLLNGLADRVTVHEVGLSDSDAKAAVARRVPRNVGATQLRADESGGIDLRKGDELLAGEAIGFLKVDVEGHEMAVLGGLSAIIARQRPPMHVEVDSANRAAFEQWCSDNGYRIAERDERGANANLVVLP